LELVAVHGEALAHDVVAIASGLDGAAVVGSIRRLRLAGLLVEAPGDPPAYASAHPLIVEVAAAELTETERRARHRALAAAFEQRRPADIGRLARHYQGAGPDVADPARAFDVLVQAGGAAAGPDEAARHLRGALSLADAGRRPEIIDRLALAERRSGRNEVAISLWGNALAEAAVAASPEWSATIHRQVGLAEWDRGRLDDARRRIDDTLLMPGLSEATLGALYETRADFADRLGDLAVLEDTVEVLGRLAHGNPTPPLIVGAALAEVALHHRRGNLRRCREAADRARTAADATDDAVLQLRACEVALNLAAEYGEPARLRRLAARSLELADQVGGPPSALRAHGCLVVAAYLAGDWELATRETDIAMSVARRAGIVRGIARSLAMRALMLAQQGHASDAAGVVLEARAALTDIGSDAHVASTLALAEAYAAIEAGDAERGLQLRAQLQDPAGSLLARRLASLGDLQVMAGDTAAARATADRIQATDDADPYTDAMRRSVLARADEVDGHPAEAATHLGAAIAVFDSVDARFEASRARLALAALTKDPDVAKVALAAFEEMGGTRWVDRARRVLRDLGVRVERRRAPSGELSGRELEVARLAAQGLTNAEIAARLVISPRTASTHLERIYRRLDVSSRAALTKRMLEAGLL
ncbi:MAG: hypothetical protein QOE80_3191, partial [Actinomycetota bacterium]|nr:hypothetical protein [Actinomycetota bacterium]